MTSSPPADYRGTRAHRPDLDWSQIKESVLMLELMAGLVRAAMRDSENSVTELATSFSAIADHTFALSEVIEKLPDTPEVSEHKATLGGSMSEMRNMLNRAIVAFQFYDRLVQRLSHVVDGQADFAEIVGDPRKLYNPEAWLSLHERIRKSFSMQEEHTLLEAVLKGVAVEQAISDYLKLLHEQNNEIELF
ncbi:hypothetical protein [Viridibacterium curvum]|uniref:Uncharacterized protein n=1 Tax=Viridibacterium curvum TaxID=1101404 RepID=A0ABP9QAC0_9RHOO